MQKRDVNGKIIRKPNLTFIFGGQVIDKCSGCEKQIASLCEVYQSPESKWRLGDCNMATHITTRIKEEKIKTRVGQQKQKIKY